MSAATRRAFPPSGNRVTVEALVHQFVVALFARLHAAGTTRSTVLLLVVALTLQAGRRWA